MKIDYKKTQANEKPLEIDVTSSCDGVYIRRDIKSVEVEQENGQTKTFWEYQEAFLTKSEYEIFASENIANIVNGNDNSEAFANYQAKLNAPVEYPENGLTYKPKWAESVYAGLIQKGMIFPQLFPLKIYDSTETEENARLMSIAELTALAMFLASVQEQYFAEYKAEKTNS